MAHTDKGLIILAGCVTAGNLSECVYYENGKLMFCVNVTEIVFLSSSSH